MWFWNLMGGILVQVNVRCCLCHILSYLFGAIKGYTVYGCLYWTLVCIGVAKVPTKANFHLYQA